LAVLAGCSLRPAPRAPIATWDLIGHLPAPRPAVAEPLPVVFVVHEPAGPLWLDSGSMHYRLGYEDPARLRRFANSQWAVSPLKLLGQRLRAALALSAAGGGAVPDLGIPADYSLRVVVEDFGQVFDSPSSSRGVVRFRVVLVRERKHVFVGQRRFEAVVEAPTADARGGVAALGRATAQSVDEAVAWVSERVAEDLQ